MAARFLGINAIFRAINKENVRILMYHGVTRKSFSPLQWTQLHIDNFEAQLDCVKKNYNVISAQELLDNNEFDNAVIVTFDDGLKNVYDHALQLLKERDLAAIIFVLPELSEKGQPIWPDMIRDIFLNTSADAIDLTEYGLSAFKVKNKSSEQRVAMAGQLVEKLKETESDQRLQVLSLLENKYGTPLEKFNPEYKLMNPDEIKELANGDIIEIGPHTNTHPILSTMCIEDQFKEVAGCLEQLDKNNIKHTMIFAYPNGRACDFTDDTINILKGNKIRMAFTTEDGFYKPGDDMYRIKRIPIGADMSIYEFRARLSGFYYFVKGLFKK